MGPPHSWRATDSSPGPHHLHGQLKLAGSEGARADSGHLLLRQLLLPPGHTLACLLHNHLGTTFLTHIISVCLHRHMPRHTCVTGGYIGCLWSWTRVLSDITHTHTESHKNSHLYVRACPKAQVSFTRAHLIITHFHTYQGKFTCDHSLRLHSHSSTPTEGGVRSSHVRQEQYKEDSHGTGPRTGPSQAARAPIPRLQVAASYLLTLQTVTALGATKRGRQ